MIKKIYPFIICLFFISGFAKAQEKTTTDFVLSGKVIDKETRKGIAFAHIKIDKTFYGTICDSLGFFHLRLTPKQKIKISALGYKTETLTIQPSEEGDVFKEIAMQKNSYMIKEVNVYAFGTWNDFKHKFIKEKLPEEEESIIDEKAIAAIAKSAARYGNTQRRSEGGIGVGIGIPLSRKDRKSLKLKKFIASENSLVQKYNKEMVAQLTKEKGKRLEYLLLYINSKAKFTSNSDEKYIIKEVLRLHQAFLHENIDTSKYYSFFDSLPASNHLRFKEK